MIGKFSVALADAFERKLVPGGIENETDFEWKFALPVAESVLKCYPAIRLFTHKWKYYGCCQPGCSSATSSGRVLGCSKCWTDSKKLATVAAFGTKHTFDMMAADRSSRRLAVEIKLVDATKSRPNGTIQRFLGQCALAAAKHYAVIGLCGIRGGMATDFQDDRRVVERHLRKQNIRLVFPTVR
jgi:hypothetical protein